MQAQGFLNINDLGREPRGDPFECFNITAHNLIDLDASRPELTRFDTSSIPGFAITIDAAPLPPSCTPDYVTYLVSTAGPIFPSPAFLTSFDYMNDDSVSAYFGAHAQALPSGSEHTLTHTFVHIKTDGTFLNPQSTFSPSHSMQKNTPNTQVLKYKPVAKKVRPVAATLPEEFRATCQIIGDPLASMSSLLLHPSEYAPTSRYNDAAHDIVNTNHPGEFLLPEERKLMHHFMMVFKHGFAWNEAQKGRFHDDFFPSIKIPVVSHMPWALRNIPIPPGIYNDVIKII